MTMIHQQDLKRVRARVERLPSPGKKSTVFIVTDHFKSTDVVDGPSKTADGPSKYLRDLLP